MHIHTSRRLPLLLLPALLLAAPFTSHAEEAAPAPAQAAVTTVPAAVAAPIETAVAAAPQPAAPAAAPAVEPAPAEVVQGASVVTVTVPQEKTKNLGKPDEDVEILSMSAEASYQDAVAAYEKAMELVAGTDRSEGLTRAISLVNHTLDLTPGDTDAMILAAQCYRARGGKAYADRYDAAAEASLKKTIMDSDFRNLGAMLDYAILCYAEGGPDKAKTAANQARYIIQTVEGSTALMESPEARRAEGLACLILGRQDLTSPLLKDTDPELSVLFEETAAQGKWKWLVKSDLASREFLLYFLRHTADRYTGTLLPAAVTVKAAG